MALFNVASGVYVPNHWKPGEGYEVGSRGNNRTAWDLFTEDDPGRKLRYKSKAGDIYEMLELLIRKELSFSREQPKDKGPDAPVRAIPG